MIFNLSKVWDVFFKPMMMRPPRLQVAALCLRGTGPTQKVLLITSRESGRWIIPKGWPMEGKTASAAAMQEAWEEAGVRAGTAESQAIGSYHYQKRLKHGLAVPVETLVYPVTVEEMRDEFPEAQERKRKWFSPSEAANLVDEPELKSLLRDIAS